LSRLQPLVIDEIGYLTLKPEQANAFFRLMDERYNRVSTIITTSGLGCVISQVSAPPCDPAAQSFWLSASCPFQS
jgi:hypothetical protein